MSARDKAYQVIEEPKTNIDYRCSYCNTEVLQDAFAAWDIDTQRWVLSSVYDTYFCPTCSVEANPIEARV